MKELALMASLGWLVYGGFVPDNIQKIIKSYIEHRIQDYLKISRIAPEKTSYAITEPVNIEGIHTWKHIARAGDQIDYLGFLCNTSRSKIRALNSHIKDPKNIVIGQTCIFLPVRRIIEVTKTGQLDRVAEEQKVSLTLLLEANGDRPNYAVEGEALNVPYQIYMSQP